MILTPVKYLDVEATVTNRAKCTKKVQQKLFKSLNKGSIRKNSVASDVMSMSHKGSEAGGKKEEDFQEFLVSMDDYIFDNQDSIVKDEQNINKVREKALLKIERLIK